MEQPLEQHFVVLADEEETSFTDSIEPSFYLDPVFAKKSLPQSL